jgi:formamidopyrimidine-DNA glycosylase
MPELPEVETVRRQMEKELKGAMIRGVLIRFGGRIFPSAKELVKAATGASFRGFGRRAKLLLLHLSNGWSIVVHLKMTGKFLLKPSSAALGKHDHLVIQFEAVASKWITGRQLIFQDIRKFGFLKLFRTDELEVKVFDKEGYGPEPLDPAFDFRKFRLCLTAHPKKKVKPLLMDQTCIAGIGNIYADEACWHGRVHPERRVGALSEAELKGVFKGAIGSLKTALVHQGSSADNFMDLYGQEGGNVPYLKVYGREGEKCRRKDGGTIKKIWIGSRGAHFCPICQK